MENLFLLKSAKEKNLKQIILPTVILFIFVAVGYFLIIGWQNLPGIFSKLPAGMFTSLGEDENNEKLAEEKILNYISDMDKKQDKYVEKAEKGEGLTHLTRRALGKHLQKNLQDFKVTDEHRIYIEDYIAKKMGEDWLEVGQEIEISMELVEGAINKSAELSPQQLDNLTQYSQLVSF